MGKRYFIVKGGEGSGVRGHTTAEPPRQSDAGRNQVSSDRNQMTPDNPKWQKHAYKSVTDAFLKIARTKDDPKAVTDIWGLADHRFPGISDIFATGTKNAHGYVDHDSINAMNKQIRVECMSVLDKIREGQKSGQTAQETFRQISEQLGNTISHYSKQPKDSSMAKDNAIKATVLTAVKRNLDGYATLAFRVYKQATPVFKGGEGSGRYPKGSEKVANPAYTFRDADSTGSHPLEGDLGSITPKIAGSNRTFNIGNIARSMAEAEIWSADEMDDKTIYDLDKESAYAVIGVVTDFVRNNLDDLVASGLSDDAIGHDISLTTNGHGAGFWDRNLGVIGERLTNACKNYIATTPEVGDDGQVYLNMRPPVRKGGAGSGRYPKGSSGLVIQGDNSSQKALVTETIPSNCLGRDFFPNQTIAQIGRMNILAISGGRINPIMSEGRTVGIELPVGKGYKVRVYLADNDTYTVQRVQHTAAGEKVKGELTDVFADEVGEQAYQASCFISNPFGGHNPN